MSIVIVFVLVVDTTTTIIMGWFIIIVFIIEEATKVTKASYFLISSSPIMDNLPSSFAIEGITTIMGKDIITTMGVMMVMA